MKKVLFFMYLCLMIMKNNAFSQQVFGVSFGYETFPSVELIDSDPLAPDLEIQSSSFRVGAALPLMFDNGKIIVMNSFNYKRTNLEYKNLPADANKIDQMQEISYTAFMIDSLSQKWKLVAVITPGLASDFEGDLSQDDFTFAAVIGLIWTTSATFDLGFGLAYMPDFGEPLPLPFIYIDWKITPKLNTSGILPSDLSLIYNYSEKIALGLALKVSGNRYHGDPDKFGVDNPLMKYSEGTFSPMIQYHFSELFHLRLEGGYAFYRNFEFFDGDEKAQSLDLKRTGYLGVQFVIGI